MAGPGGLTLNLGQLEYRHNRWNKQRAPNCLHALSPILLGSWGCPKRKEGWGQGPWRYLLVALRRQQTGLVPFFYINVLRGDEQREPDLDERGQQGETREKEKPVTGRWGEKVQDWSGEGGSPCKNRGFGDVKCMHSHTHTTTGTHAYKGRLLCMAYLHVLTNLLGQTVVYSVRVRYLGVWGTG